MSTQNRIRRAFAAFALVVAFVPARPLVAQQLLAPAVEVNSQVSVQPDQHATLEVPSDSAGGFTKRYGAIGMALGLYIPGAGQIYAGRYGKGLAVAGITFGGMLLAEASCGGELKEECLGNAMVGLAALFGAWGYGILSAPRDAREYNERQSHRIAVEPVLDRRVGRTGLGLALRY